MFCFHGNETHDSLNVCLMYFLVNNRMISRKFESCGIVDNFNKLCL